MSENIPQKTFSWHKTILTVLAIILVAGAISGALYWYFVVRQLEESTITSKTGTSSAKPNGTADWEYYSFLHAPIDFKYPPNFYKAEELEYPDDYTSIQKFSTCKFKDNNGIAEVENLECPVFYFIHIESIARRSVMYELVFNAEIGKDIDVAKNFEGFEKLTIKREKDMETSHSVIWLVYDSVQTVGGVTKYAYNFHSRGEYLFCVKSTSRLTVENNKQLLRKIVSTLELKPLY